ncbi:MAG: HAMP domain-containing histidine kinase [bacterium]|nr:HAMP domain-containing histidine kinase [bacterium]
MQKHGRPVVVLTPEFLTGLLRRICVRAAAGFARSVQEFEPNFRWMGFCGAVCFLFYWVIWKYSFPQPYENLPLRIAGAGLALGLALSDRWPPAWRRRWLIPYAYITLLYVFPFFFTYMLLQNQGGSVWAMSTLVACFLMMLLVDVLTLVCMQLLGSGLAVLLYLATGPGDPGLPFLHSRELLLFVFLILMGGVFNIRAELMRREKSRAMLLMGARMAHEMRTPLAGIKIGLAGLSRLLEQTTQAYGQTPDETHLRQVRLFKQQIIAQANHAGTIIDMLLLNANRENTARSPVRMEPLLFSELLSTTLENFPFVSTGERELVRVSGSFQFTIRGQRDLLICVLYNLIKNALYAVHRAGRSRPGCIQIIDRPGQDSPDDPEAALVAGRRVLVRDSGDGISPADLPRIFDQFFTTKPDCDGIGIGLWNTRHILRAHGGEIQCRSRPGRYTEFELNFPTVSAAAGSRIDAADETESPGFQDRAQGSGQSPGRTVSRTLDSA